MFEESLVESNALLQTHNRWPALLSFGAQAVAALFIVLVPVFHPELLPVQAPSVLLAPPPPPRPPQPTPPLQHLRVALAATEAPTVLSAPTAQRVFLHTQLPTNPSVADIPLTNPTMIRMGDTNTSIPGLTNSPGAAHVAMVSVASAPHADRVTLSSGVTTGMLLAPIRPEYPAIAKAARMEGTVVVRAIISRTGQIERAEVVSGPPLLQGAGLDAVEHARYKPYLLNGQPTEVDTTVTINFRLGS